MIAETTYNLQSVCITYRIYISMINIITHHPSSLKIVYFTWLVTSLYKVPPFCPVVQELHISKGLKKMTKLQGWRLITYYVEYLIMI